MELISIVGPPTNPFQSNHSKQLLDCNTKSINLQSLSICEKSPFLKKTSGVWEATRSARCRTSPGVPCSSSSTLGSTSLSSFPSSLLPTSASSPISCWTGESDHIGTILDQLCWWGQAATCASLAVVIFPSCNIFLIILRRCQFWWNTSQLDMLLICQNANYKLYLNLWRCQFW